MEGVEPVDLVAAAILGVACLRGLFNGLIREVFSFLALGAAVVAVAVWNAPFAAWLGSVLGERVGAAAVPWISGAVLAVAGVLAVGVLGGAIRRGARAVGLGWADRAGGAALGAAEGAVVVGVLLLLLGSVVGRDHAVLAETRSLAVLERVERVSGGGATPDVAAPAPGD